MKNENIGFTLFLDFDGVLNNERYLRLQKNIGLGGESPFDLENIKELNELCEKILFKYIVISSSWNKTHSIESLSIMLKNAGFINYDMVSHVTENIHANASHGRALEIKEWIRKYDIQNYIILDDMNLSQDFKKGFFKVNPAKGLTSELVKDIYSYSLT